ncbi:hypothetical protein Droror1_Dr00018491 [Drosera rotundifolia]
MIEEMTHPFVLPLLLFFTFLFLHLVSALPLSLSPSPLQQPSPTNVAALRPSPSLLIRGRILAGTCHSAKIDRTIIVRRNYLHYIKKYQQYEKRHSNIPAHISPCFHVKEGNHVIIGQCRFIF